MTPAKRTAVAAAIGMMSIGLTAGCAASYSPTGHPAAVAQAPAPRPVRTPHPSRVIQATFPVAAYQLTFTQMADVDYLTQRLQQTCMQKYGFRYNSGLSIKSILQEVRINDEFETRLYGVSDPSVARTYGYQLPGWVQGTAPPTTGASLPHAELVVLAGKAASYRNQPVPEGGCIGQAARQMLAAGISAQTQQSGGSGPANLAARIQLTSFERAQSDPRVRAVDRKWSACMRSYRDSYANPFKPSSDPRWAASATPSRLEIQTAEHDISCKRRTNLLGVEFAVISDYENAAIAKDARALTEVRANIRIQAVGIRKLMTHYAK